jgi:hypothetical protein
MKRTLWWFPIVSIAALGVASGAAAQSVPQLDIRIERDNRPRTSAVALGAYHTVTIADRATGVPPTRPYEVFGQATNKNGEQTDFDACDHASDFDSRVSPGVYNCAVFVDHGGAWEFIAIVKEPRRNPTETEVTAEVARASVPFELATDQVYAGDPDSELQTSAATVLALWIHVLVTTGWFGCVALLAVLAVPELRRRLSSFGLNRLERRLDLLLKVTWSATAGVVGSGVYLLLNETAYQTPFSSAKMDAVFALPYAKPYFLALGAKLALYAVMVLAVVPLAKGARRQLHLGFGSREPEPVPDASGREGGAVATLTRATVTAPASQGLQPAGSRLGRISVAVMLAGALGISLSVTLLKYFHQIIEAVPR